MARIARICFEPKKKKNKKKCVALLNGHRDEQHGTHETLNECIHGRTAAVTYRQATLSTAANRTPNTAVPIGLRATVGTVCGIEFNVWCDVLFSPAHNI